MALHLIKLCVGVDTVEDLEQWLAAHPSHGHVTRQTPRRTAELLDGGSLYWVIRGAIQCRQPILALEEARKADASACRIVLGAPLTRTLPAPRRAFQGWRYLDAKDAPADLTAGRGADLPDDLRRRLMELGAW